MSFLGGLGRAAGQVTDSTAFRRWFGNSVVVNPDGSPRVVYHGTKADVAFTEFSFPRSEIGVHFGTIAQASEFVQPYDKDTEERRPRVYPVYLSIQNPLRLDDHISWTAPIILKQLLSRRLLSEKEREAVEDALSKPPVHWKLTEKWSLRTPAIIMLSDLLISKGYDGIVYLNEAEGTQNEDSYIILRPGQVKSAIGNRGTWDMSDPNILHGWRRR